MDCMEGENDDAILEHNDISGVGELDMEHISMQAGVLPDGQRGDDQRSEPCSIHGSKRADLGIIHEREEPDVDSGWAWLVLIASCVLNMFFGITFVLGIFNVIFLDVFGQTRQVTAWVSAVQTSSMSLYAPLAAYLTSRFGSRTTVLLGGSFCALGYLLTVFAKNFLHLFCTFGLITGCGIGLIYVPAVTCLTEYFKRYRNLVLGLSNAVVGVGTILFSPLVQYLNDQYGWRGCMLIMSGLHLHCLVAGALLKPKRQQIRQHEISTIKVNPTDLEETYQMDVKSEMRNIKQDPSSDHQRIVVDEVVFSDHSHPCSNLIFKSDDMETQADDIESEFVPNLRSMDNRNTKKRTLCNILMDKKLSLLVLNVFLANGACYLTFIHFPDFFYSQGASETDMSIVFSVLGVCSLSCRLMYAVMSNIKEIGVLLLYISGVGLAAIVVLACPLLGKSFAGQIVFAFGFGFYSNSFGSLLPQMTLELCAVKDLPTAFGIQLIVCGISGIAGPPFAGWLYDITGNYSMTFILAGSCYAVGTMAMMSVPLIKS